MKGIQQGGRGWAETHREGCDEPTNASPLIQSQGWHPARPGKGVRYAPVKTQKAPLSYGAYRHSPHTQCLMHSFPARPNNFRPYFSQLVPPIRPPLPTTHHPSYQNPHPLITENTISDFLLLGASSQALARVTQASAFREPSLGKAYPVLTTTKISLPISRPSRSPPPPTPPLVRPFPLGQFGGFHP